MPGNGKIARLPVFIRNQVNERLQNGEEGKDIVAWLNGMSGVRDILDDKFDGRPISEQNLREWKQRGHQVWLKREEKRSLLRDFLDEADEIEEEVGETPLTDRVSEVATLALLQLLRAELASEDKGPKHRARVLEIMRELSRFRERDHEMERMHLQSERWEIEYERMKDEDRRRDIKEMKEHVRGKIWSALYRPTLVKAFGGGESGEKVADFLHKVDYEMFSAWGPGGSGGMNLNGAADSAKPTDPTESNPIKPSQSESFAQPADADSISHSIRPKPTKSDS